MPRPTRAHGRPGTAVIPADWSQGLAPVVAKTRTGWCVVRRPGGTAKAFDHTTLTTTRAPFPPHHIGSCSVDVRRAADTEAGEQPATTQTYLVTLDQMDATTVAPIVVDDIVTVTDPGTNGSPSLAGVDLVVTSVERGTLTWELVLTCVEHATAARVAS